MQKISSSTGTATPAGEFTSGNPAGGIPATLITAEWLTSVQRELAAVLSAAGVALNPANDAQLLEAIGALNTWGNLRNKPASFPPVVHTHTWGSIEGKPTEFPVGWSSVDNKPNAINALTRVTTISADTALSAAHMGLVLVDANAAARSITLPLANADLGVADIIIRRTDNSGNRLVVNVAGSNKIKFHTHLRPEGYPFLVLMGAGDWWHLRSDGQGNWWPLSRLDGDALGRPVFETTTLVAPGGWGVFSGTVFNRTEWPWMWDHAQQSGMFTTEAARVGMEGGWTSGDGALTFRGPDGRGEFLRILDGGRGVDSSRVAGSWQVDDFKSHSHDTNVYPEKLSGGNYSTVRPSSGSGYLTSNTGGTETRPRNIAYPGRIKLI